MNRRTFLAMPSGALLAALGALAVPHAALGQPGRKVARIGLMDWSGPVERMTGAEPLSPAWNAFARGLRELGYVHGRDYVTEARGFEPNRELWPALAAELVRLQVDIIVVAGQQVRACKEATSTIPIVMVAAGDPVGDGLVQTLARPGGNITGLSDQGFELIGKRLEMLKEIVPANSLVAIIAGGPIRKQYTEEYEAPARKLGLKLLWLEIRDASEIEGAFRAAKTAGAGSVVVDAVRITSAHRQRVAELAIEVRLPTMHWYPSYVVAGGLMSYQADYVDICYRAAVFVDKILKGAKPADLPVEQPTKFDLVINLKAAKGLGLTIPQSLLVRADEVIQ